MKNLKYIIGSIFILFLFSNLNAQDIDKIIAKHIEAHGGQEAWDAIENMKIKGLYTGYSETKSFESYKAKPDLYFSDYWLGQHPMLEAYDGKNAWCTNPWFGFDWPYLASEAETNTILFRAEMCTPFLNYKEKGHEVELLGEEEVEGVKAYKIKVKRNTGVEETWFLNAETYLEMICNTTWQDFTYPQPGEFYFDDFQKIGDIVLPFYSEVTFGTRYHVVEIQNIDFNTELPEDIFKFPISDEMSKLKFMEGEWSVIYENFHPRRQSWARLDSVGSKIEFLSNSNFLRGNISHNRYFPRIKEFNWSFNMASERYRMTMLNKFASNISVYEGEVTDSLIYFENTQIKYDSAFVVEQPVRFEIKDIKENSFTLEMLRSTDGGITWNGSDRFYYTRKE